MLREATTLALFDQMGGMPMRLRGTPYRTETIASIAKKGLNRALVEFTSAGFLSPRKRIELHDKLTFFACPVVANPALKIIKSKFYRKPIVC